MISLVEKILFIEIKNDVMSNFQLRIESNPGLLWYFSSSLCDWFKKLLPSSQTEMCKMNKGERFLKKLGCCVSGEYNEIVLSAKLMM